MKRYIFMILVLLLGTAGMVGCSKPDTPTGSGEKVHVVSTIFPPYDFVKEIAGDFAEVTMLLPPGSESHSYEPTPQDIIKIQNCDVFVYVGGESDAWVEGILKSMDTSQMKIVTLMDCVETVEEEWVEGMEVPQEHGHEDEDGNHDDEDNHGITLDEHVWTSPKNAKRIVEKLSDVLCEVDSIHGEAYNQNTATYLEQLDQLDTAFQEVVDGATRKTVVFGDRFPFRYLADAYGLDYYAAFPGCSTETGASPATIAFLIDKIKAEDIPVVFHLELSNKKMAETISEATGAEVRLFHACHNVTKDEMTRGVTYLELMNQNTENLKEALL